MNFENKKILIISHNPLSQVSNNGKTLVSIFQGIPKKNIYQIYLNTDNPDYSDECHYLQINEKQILKSLLKMKNICCQEISATPGEVSSVTIRKCNYGNHTKRLIRELVWKFSFWKVGLQEWLKGKKFDVVFFMAGDGMFAYDVYLFVMKNTIAKGCLFFTDDYILGKASFSPVAMIRRILLKNKINKTLKITKDLYVISDEMKGEYNKIFGVEGHVIRNFSNESLSLTSQTTNKNEDYLVMLYAGGLHYNRWKVLARIANTLKEINKFSKKKCYLEIYSSQNISQDILDEISMKGVSKFMGGVEASKIAEVYAHADILLHVESFEKTTIASTKYSFSTKIPEYLSANKCVVAVGPREVASIQYLSKCACVICNDDSFSTSLFKIVNDKKYRELIQSNCMRQYENDFSKEKQRKSLEQIFLI